MNVNATCERKHLSKIITADVITSREQHKDIKLPIPINESSTHMYF